MKPFLLKFSTADSQPSLSRPACRFLPCRPRPRLLPSPPSHVSTPVNACHRLQRHLSISCVAHRSTRRATPSKFSAHIRKGGVAKYSLREDRVGFVEVSDNGVSFFFTFARRRFPAEIIISWLTRTLLLNFVSAQKPGRVETKPKPEGAYRSHQWPAGTTPPLQPL